MEIRPFDGFAHPVVLLGVCQGLAGEADGVVAALDELKPSAIALAVPHEVVPHLESLEAATEHGLEDSAYAVGLARWGEVTLPPPELAAALVAGRRLDVPVIGIDIGEEAYIDLFAERIGVRHLVRRAWRLRWLGWRQPEAETPEGYCRAFDARINRGPFADLEREREAAMVRSLAELNEGGSTVLVVEVQRLDGLTNALRALPRSASARPLV